MTPDQRREHLHEQGFRIARRPFRDGVIFSMMRLLDDGSWDPKQRQGRQYSVNLQTGEWNCWGVDPDGVWHPWTKLLEADSRSSIEQATEANPPEKTGPVFEETLDNSFIERCVNHGFSIDDDIIRNVDFGNRFARFNGIRYLLVINARVIMSERFESCSLDEFFKRSSGKSPVAMTTPARPFVSMREQPLQMQGCNVQTSLF